MKQRINIGYNQKRRGSKVLWIFIGIISFGIVFFPFFGSTLAYQVREAYSLLRGAGCFLIFAGIFLTCFGLFRIKKRSGKIILIGLVVLLVGFVLVYPFNFNFLFFGSTTKGYH